MSEVFGCVKPGLLDGEELGAGAGNGLGDGAGNRLGPVPRIGDGVGVTLGLPNTLLSRFVMLEGGRIEMLLGLTVGCANGGV